MKVKELELQGKKTQKNQTKVKLKMKNLGYKTKPQRLVPCSTYVRVAASDSR